MTPPEPAVPRRGPRRGPTPNSTTPETAPDREAAGRRRTRRLAIGLAAVLVVALVAAGLAVLSQREAQRASLVADANRLAALSTSVGSLDLSYLLAAEAYRLADTPQTQDGLLATLAEHRRVTRAVPFPNRVLGAALANGTLFIGGATRLLSWTPTSGELPHEIRDLMQDEWARSWGPSVPSPTDGVWGLAGFDGDDAWIGLVDAEGGVRLLEGADALGGRRWRCPTPRTDACSTSSWCRSPTVSRRPAGTW